MATEYTESHNQILKDTLPELPGAVRSVALRELRLAMREFFERSMAWTAVIDNVAVPNGNTPIQLDDGDANTEVIGIFGVEFGTDANGYQLLTPMNSRPSKYEGNESPWGWYVTSNPDELRLHPYVNVDTTKVIRASVALIPAFDTDATETDLPRQITLKYYDAIRNGFLARMYMHPAKPYSQPVLATQLRHNFLRQIGFYAAQRRKGYNNTPAWRYPATGWRPSRRTGVSNG